MAAVSAPRLRLAFLLLGLVASLSSSLAAGQGCPSEKPNACFNAPGTSSVCCPGSCGASTGPGGETATCAGGAAPTLSFKALFDFSESTANCKGQAAAPGEGTKFGDYCIYVAPLFDESGNPVGNSTYEVTNYRTSTPEGNYYELSTTTFFFGPVDSGTTDTISTYGALLVESTESIILGGTGKYRGARGYVLTRPQECSADGNICYFPKDLYLV